jgi:hypothetical protein
MSRADAPDGRRTTFMLKDARLWTAVVALAVGVVLIGRAAIPGRPPTVAAQSVPEIRYVCRESGEVFTLPMAGSPLAHPKTGRTTLVPARYDEKRKRWLPGPPVEIMHRKGLLKPAS